MKGMRLADMNRHIATRDHQGTPHNTGIHTKEALQAMGQEIKKNPPKILAHTKKKFGAKRAEAQRKSILLNKARKAGAKIPRQ